MENKERVRECFKYLRFYVDKLEESWSFSDGVTAELAIQSIESMTESLRLEFKELQEGKIDVEEV